MINLFILPFTEGMAPFQELMRVGPIILLSNASIAFGLNVAAVFLIGVTSSLVLTLAGVFKVPSSPILLRSYIPDLPAQDILLISGSVLIFSYPITPLQVFGKFLSPRTPSVSDCSPTGYSVALGGLILFKTSGGK